MNSKTLVGFVAGVAVALGLSYLISHRGSEQKAAEPVAAVAPSAPPAAPEPPEAQIAKPAPEPVATAPATRLTPSSIVRPRAAAAPSISHAPRETASAPPPVAQPAPVTAPTPAPAPAPAPVAAAPVVITTPEPAPRPAPTTEARVFRPEPAPAARPAAREPSTVILKEGTVLNVRLGEGLSTDRNRSGDEFTATLDQALIVDNLVVAERGARLEGRVIDSQLAGRVKGLSHLSIELTRLHTSDGQRINIRTAAHSQDGQESKKEDAAKVGAGAAIGAIIGAIAGGGKGAAIGAGVGGAAGGGTVAATRGKAVVLPVETRLTFRLQEPVTITEQLRN